jgi:hypothetical protein
MKPESPATGAQEPADGRCFDAKKSNPHPSYIIVYIMYNVLYIMYNILFYI